MSREKKYTRRNVSLTEDLEAMEKMLRKHLHSKNRSDSLAILISREFDRRGLKLSSDIQTPASADAEIISRDTGALRSHQPRRAASKRAGAGVPEVRSKKTSPKSP